MLNRLHEKFIPVKKRIWERVLTQRKSWQFTVLTLYVFSSHYYNIIYYLEDLHMPDSV
jgi:hypothetical protein